MTLTTVTVEEHKTALRSLTIVRCLLFLMFIASVSQNVYIFEQGKIIKGMRTYIQTTDARINHLQAEIDEIQQKLRNIDDILNHRKQANYTTSVWCSIGRIAE